MKSILLTIVTFIFLLNTNAQVIADAGPDRKGCVNDTFKAVGKGLNPGDTGSYLWTDLNAGVLSNQQMLIKLFPTQQYHIELKVSRLHNGITYIDRDSFYLTVNGLPQIKLFTPDTICSSAPAVNMQSNYALNDPNGKWIGKYITGSNFDPSLSPKIQAFEVVKIVYKYTNPLTLCTDSAITKKTIQSQPSVSILNNNPYQLCEDQIFHLNANVSNALNVVWTTTGDGIFGSATKATTTYVCGNQDTANGNCTVTVKTNQFGQCPSSNSTITLAFEPYPVFTMPMHYVSCEPAVINFDTYIFNFSGASKLRYSWDFGNGDTLDHSSNGSPKSIKYPIAKQGWYDVKVKVHNQWGTAPGEECTIIKDSIDYVRVIPTPKAAFTSDPAYFATANGPTFNFINQSTIRWGSMSYQYQFDLLHNWNDTSTLSNPSHTYSSDTAKYYVLLTSRHTYPRSADPRLLTEDFVCTDTTGAVRIIIAAEEELKIFTIDKNKRINISIPFNGELAIMDANGDAIELRKTKAGKREQLDIEDWNAGCYIIVLDNCSKRKYAKFMKY